MPQVHAVKKFNARWVEIDGATHGLLHLALFLHPKYRRGGKSVTLHTENIRTVSIAMDHCFVRVTAFAHAITHAWLQC